MKIRTSFVTNSSSSSFTIMYKQMPELDEETKNKYPFLVNMFRMFEKALSDSKPIRTVEELNTYFLSNYGWRDMTLEQLLKEDGYCKEKYEKYVVKINQGYGIALKEVDNNDEGLSDLLWSLNDGEIFIVESEY